MWSTLSVQKRMHGERRAPEMALAGKRWEFRKVKWLLLGLQWWDGMKMGELINPNLHFEGKIINGHLVMDWLWEFWRDSCQRRQSASCPTKLSGWSTAGRESCRRLGLAVAGANFSFGEAQLDFLKTVGYGSTEVRKEVWASINLLGPEAREMCPHGMRVGHGGGGVWDWILVPEGWSRS